MARPNAGRFHLWHRHCADFARVILHFYDPGALRRSDVADLGISAPKHSGKALVKYPRRRPEPHLAQFVIPQVPGLRPSTRVRGVNESLIRPKKYLAPLLVVQPWVAATAGVAYLAAGRFNPANQSLALCEPASLRECTAVTEPMATSFRKGSAESPPARPALDAEGRDPPPRL